MTGNANQPERPKPRATARESAHRLIEELQRAGHIAYWAGGCVRDMLRGDDPQDYDIATSARPEDVCKLFRRTRKVGAQFGVVLVRMGRRDFEVATFRTDHDYADGRRPTGVTFSTPEQDAQRRDFTINGMFFDPVADALHDFVGGKADLSARVIRAIGVAADRFAEDHLRILRAVKFASRFEFAIEPNTWDAMRASAASLTRISAERIRMELESMLARPGRASAISMLANCGAFDFLWNSAASLRDGTERIVKLLDALPNDTGFELSMAAILSAKDSAYAYKACRALRGSNFTIDRVSWLVAHQSALDNPNAVTLADLKLLMANDAFDDLLSLSTAIHIVDGHGTVAVQTIRERASAIPQDQIAPPPLVTGEDLGRLRLPPGPAYKRILDRLYYEQLNDELTTRDAALDRAIALATDSEPPQ